MLRAAPADPDIMGVLRHEPLITDFARRDGLRMVTTLNLYQRQVSAEHSTGNRCTSGLHISRALARGRYRPKMNKVSTGDFWGDSVHRIAHSLTIPNDHFL